MSQKRPLDLVKQMPLVKMIYFHLCEAFHEAECSVIVMRHVWNLRSGYEVNRWVTIRPGPTQERL